uniref:Uncharacterized protein n=1 Tax=Nannospalax galili TaxID=1026970 RepID=A0A8C6R4D1_NANGA
FISPQRPPQLLAGLLSVDEFSFLKSQDNSFSIQLLDDSDPLISDTFSSSERSTPEATSNTSPSSTDLNLVSTPQQPETGFVSSSGSPSSELTTALQSTTMTPQEWLSVSSPGQGSEWISTSHRNPGVVISVCLLVSVLIIGSVLIAVRRYNRDVSAFHNLDRVSMGSVSQRLPFADNL